MEGQGDFRFALYPVGEVLRGYCHGFYAIECGEGGIEDIAPAYSPQMLLFTQGSAQIAFASGVEDRSLPTSVTSQIDEAAAFRIEGPARIVGASLTIAGWVALGGPPLDRCVSRLLPLADVFGAELAERLEQVRLRHASGEVDDEAATRQVEQILTDALRPMPARQRRFIDAVVAWLGSAFDPDLEDLHDSLALSPRQIQRLCRRYFGNAPSGLAKRHRAIRAATLLAADTLPESLEAEIYAAYFDQSHLIRDIRRYTGRTPRRLEDGDASLAAETLVRANTSNDALFERLATAYRGETLRLNANDSQQGVFG